MYKKLFKIEENSTAAIDRAAKLNDEVKGLLRSICVLFYAQQLITDDEYMFLLPCEKAFKDEFSKLLDNEAIRPLLNEQAVKQLMSQVEEYFKINGKRFTREDVMTAAHDCGFY